MSKQAKKRKTLPLLDLDSSDAVANSQPVSSENKEQRPQSEPVSNTNNEQQQKLYEKTQKEDEIVQAAMRKQEEKIRIDAATSFFQQTFEDMRRFNPAATAVGAGAGDQKANGMDPVILKEIEELMQKAQIAQENSIRKKSSSSSSSSSSSTNDNLAHREMRAAISNIFTYSITEAQRLQQLRDQHSKLVASRTLPQIGFTDIQRTLITATTYKLQKSKAVLIAPPCARRADCVGLSRDIRMEDNLQEINRSRLMCWMTRDEYNRWKSTGVPPFQCEKRRCFLCDFVCRSIDSASCMLTKGFYSCAEGIDELASQIQYIVCTGTDDTVSMQAFENAEASDLQENAEIGFAVPLVQLNLLSWKRSPHAKLASASAYIDFSAYRGSITNTQSTMPVFDPIKELEPIQL